MFNKKHNEFNETIPEAETFQTQALEIKEPDKNFDPSSKPESGDEYLTHMLYERKRCPAIVVCKPKEMKVQVYEQLVSLIEEKKIDQTHQSETFLTTIHWRVAQLAEFQKARDEVNNVRQSLSTSNYRQSLELPLTNDTNDWQQFCQTNQPFLSIILRFDQHKLEQLLEMIELWFACGIESEKTTPMEETVKELERNDDANEEKEEEEIEKKDVEEEVVKDEIKEDGKNKEIVAEELSTAASPETIKTLRSSLKKAVIKTSSALIDILGNDNWLGQWLYGTLACLHLPLEPSVHSTLRNIARHCIQQRSLWAQQNVEKGLPFNVFIYLIAKVFNQLDFENFV